jgi:hypothetical protein
MEELQTDLERAEYLQTLLVSFSTGGSGNDEEYKALRKHFLDNSETAHLLPKFVRLNRDLGQFWGYIKYAFGHYAERREFIWSEFRPLLDYFEGRSRKPADDTISSALKSFDSEGVHMVWARALERRESDPEGAITAARTLLETVCKHILDSTGIQYDRDKIELPELYRLTSNALNLAPSQHTFDVFKQILGGVTSVVNGLGSLRNRLGDAHGQGKRPVRPASRHAQLAVNLAGAVALFLVETWLARSDTTA